MFSWIPIQEETAQRLLTYRDKRGELIALLHRMKAAGLNVISMEDMDGAGNATSLQDVDPFTFLATFNRNLKHENRRAAWEWLKREWQLQSPVPDDFEGIPTFNNMSAWMFLRVDKRDARHIPALWELFARALGLGAPLDAALVDECSSFPQTKLPKLSIGAHQGSWVIHPMSFRDEWCRE